MAEGGEHAPDVSVQKAEIGHCLLKELQKGQIWYLIDRKWFEQFQRYVGLVDDGESALLWRNSPGPINNESLYRDSSFNDIRDNLEEQEHYTLVPEEGWNMLVQWYGMKEGQKPISRKVVEFGEFSTQCKVEIYLVELKLWKNFTSEDSVVRSFSQIDTIGILEAEMRRVFKIQADEKVHLWSVFSGNNYNLLNNLEKTVQEEGLYRGQTIVIEPMSQFDMKRRSGRTMDVTHHKSSKPFTEEDYDLPILKPLHIRNPLASNEGRSHVTQPGLCGLCNIGNTCFMNSVIQCMSNIPPITRYFMNNVYLKELNMQNPLGMKGEIAKAFGDLLKGMWSGSHSCFVPKNFKFSVGRFAPQFSGNQQHDSQELLTFLLDGLHEDLNRIQVKPYVQVRDAEGRPDHIVAKEAWESYQERNNSIIVDLFHGLLKSTVICPDCNKVSVTFDPFCSLSTPLPFVRERYIEIFLVPYDPMKRPIQYKVSVPKKGNVYDLCNSLSQISGIDAEKMLVVELYQHRLRKVFSQYELLKTIEENDNIFVYELPVNSDDLEHIILPVSSNEISKGNAGTSYQFGYPIVVVMHRDECTFNVTYDTILNKMVRFLRIPNEDSLWSGDNSSNLSNGEGRVNELSTEQRLKKYFDNLRLGNVGKPFGHRQGAEESGFRSSENDVSNSNDGYLFTMDYIKSLSGFAQSVSLQNDGKLLDFSDRKGYISIHWPCEIKKTFYNDQEARAMEQHESLFTKQLQRMNLQECVELFTTVERLGADNAWYCSTCEKHQCATKKLDVWKLPMILIIHLKRFSYSRHRRNKLDTMVDFPLQGLDLSGLIINQEHPPAIYDLIGVCNHYGGMGGGHYTAFARNKDDNKWYCFDDSSVSQIRDETVISNAAYVLFYMRRDDGSSSFPEANKQPSQEDIDVDPCSSDDKMNVDSEYSYIN